MTKAQGKQERKVRRLERKRLAVAAWLETKGIEAGHLEAIDVANVAYKALGINKVASKKSLGSLHARLSYILQRTGHSFPRAPKKPAKASVSQTQPGGVISHDDPRIREFYKSFEWKRLSYQTKLRCGRRCMCCGKKPAHDNDVELHSDHIKPIRRYWYLRLDPSNVQVLCGDCNFGKGSWDETDFREPRLSVVMGEALK